ncbi:hypothetical protein ACWCP6_17920 [Streptomyces sp. NPDC002004]
MTTPTDAAAAGDTPGRPATDTAYWARVRAVVDQAPPLTDDQRARIRAIFHQQHATKEAA